MKLLLTAVVLAAGALVAQVSHCVLTQTAEVDAVATLGFRTLYGAEDKKT
jgi:hypothetical protein